MRILITGNSGYIGSHLTTRLLKQHNITGFDLNHYKIKPHEHVANTVSGSYKWINAFDCVIHLAALVRVGDSEKYPNQYYMTNFMGTLNLLNNVPTKHFIFASTGGAEYCNNPYAVSKRAAEDCIKEWCTNRKIDYSIFRFYNVIGNTVVEPTNPDGLFYKLKQSIQTGQFTIYGHDYNTLDGTAVRDYIHVDEVCDSIEKAINKPANNIENLGHGKGHSVLEIATKFKEVNNVDFEIHLGLRRRGDLEYSVLKNPSSYMTQSYSIEEMLKVK
jgi:UDP-glucose 4-epimerase